MSILSLNTAAIFNAIGGGSPLSIINSVLHPQYVIRDHKKSSVALEFSGMASIQPSGRAQITTAPVEGGKYQSINKVKEPSIVRCAIVVSGLTGFSGSIPNIFDLTFTSQSRVLETLKTMLETANTYDIETPKETLESYDLVDHSYEVSSERGVTLLTVYLYFQEVMQQMEVILSGAQADEKPTDNEKSQGNSGVSDTRQQAGSSPSTVDKLSKSWSSLKSSIGDIVDTAQEGITTSFQSAMNTVLSPVSDVVGSASEKATDLAKNIAKNSTGGAA